jgi:hypothetical protein
MLEFVFAKNPVECKGRGGRPRRHDPRRSSTRAAELGHAAMAGGVWGSDHGHGRRVGDSAPPPAGCASGRAGRVARWRRTGGGRGEDDGELGLLLLGS